MRGLTADMMVVYGGVVVDGDEDEVGGGSIQ
jgi:hypothetical protein